MSERYLVASPLTCFENSLKTLNRRLPEYPLAEINRILVLETYLIKFKTPNPIKKDIKLTQNILKKFETLIGNFFQRNEPVVGGSADEIRVVCKGANLALAF